MKLEDMIMVIENRDGRETNRLLDLTDYMEAALKLWGDHGEDMAGAIGALYETKTEKREWSDLYVTEGRDIRAAFCDSLPQLRGFLMGNFNAGGKWSYDGERSSESCAALLRAYGIGTDGHSLPGPMHYEPVAHTFRAGEIFRNLNGKDYRVLAALSPENLLLIGQSNGQLVVAKDARLFDRYPKGERPDETNTLRGVEWGHGVYLGSDITKLDFDILKQEYGEPDRTGGIPNRRDKIRETFRIHSNVEQKEGLALRVRKAAKEAMKETFGTDEPEVFETMLARGMYDMMSRTEDGFRKKTGHSR